MPQSVSRLKVSDSCAEGEGEQNLSNNATLAEHNAMVLVIMSAVRVHRTNVSVITAGRATLGHAPSALLGRWWLREVSWRSDPRRCRLLAISAMGAPASGRTPCMRSRVSISASRLGCTEAGTDVHLGRLLLQDDAMLEADSLIKASQP